MNIDEKELLFTAVQKLEFEVTFSYLRNNTVVCDDLPS